MSKRLNRNSVCRTGLTTLGLLNTHYCVQCSWLLLELCSKQGRVEQILPGLAKHCTLQFRAGIGQCKVNSAHCKGNNLQCAIYNTSSKFCTVKYRISTVHLKLYFAEPVQCSKHLWKSRGERAVQCKALQFSAVHNSTLQCSALQYSAVKQCMQCSAV